MVGLPDDAIWSLLSGWSRRDGPLLPWLEAAAGDAGLAPDETASIAEALSILGELQRRADRHSPAEVVAWLVDRTGYAAVLDALPDRVQRRANLDRLLTLAERAPSDGTVLLSDWIALLRRRVDRPPRERDASLPEAGDRVRVMTIHQSKGLEFPIVALADIGGKTPEGLGGVAFDPDLGVVSKWWEDAGAEPEPTLGYRAAKETAARRERAEEGRLLYVAATRARDHLVLSAGATDHWWAGVARDFAASDAGRALVRTLPIREWHDRFAAALGQSPPLAPPGVPILEPMPAAPGEATTRELAAVMAGFEGAAGPPWSRASAAAEDALRRGELGHRALERFPLSRPEDVAAWLAGPGGLSDAEARTLAAYVDQEVLPRLASASTVVREHSFRLHVQGGGIVTGAIDVLWRTAGGDWWVGDYKFAEADPASGARHEAQLAIYALAAAAALGLEEVNGRLWYLDEGGSRELRWGAADLADTEGRIDEAFQRLYAASATASSNGSPSS
jgi:ATP-dependent helicase/nuclease subunit A